VKEEELDFLRLFFALHGDNHMKLKPKKKGGSTTNIVEVVVKSTPLHRGMLAAKWRGVSRQSGVFRSFHASPVLCVTGRNDHARKKVSPFSFDFIPHICRLGEEKDWELGVSLGNVRDRGLF